MKQTDLYMSQASQKAHLFKIYAAYKNTTGTNKTFNAILIIGADGLLKQSFCLVLENRQKKFGK